MKKKILSLILVLSLAFSCLALPGLAETTGGMDMSELFSKRDSKTDYDADEAVTIELSGGTASCASDAVSVDGGTVTIAEEGTYILSGALEGMVIVH
ncbi:MAG: hypothetical protein IJ048_07745, partial [Clostridia bacterium]|nr:hypothetical protein [Clostridia bacterium]